MRGHPNFYEHECSPWFVQQQPSMDSRRLSPEEHKLRSKTGEFDTSILLDSPEMFTSGEPSMGLRPRGLPEDHQVDWPHAWYGGYTVPNPAQRSFNRQTEPEITGPSWRSKREDNGVPKSQSCGTRRVPDLH